MNYKSIYDQLCSRSMGRKWEKFKFERHHIIPKCFGGGNEKSNIAILTPREHALAHMLLVKFLSGTEKARMVYALKSLLNYRNSKRNKLTSKQYENLKRSYQAHCRSPEYSTFLSERTRMQWTPERRKSVSEKTKQQWETGVKRKVFNSDEYRNKKSVQMKERWKDPTYQKQVSDRVKEQWKNPLTRPPR